MNAMTFPLPSGRGHGRNTPQTTPPPGRLRRELPAKGPAFETWLTLLAVIAFGMAVLGLTHLVTETGAAGRLKVLLAALGLAGVSLATNKVAVRYGAYYAAIGYPLAGIASVLGIGFIGSAMWSVSVGGMILPDVAQLQLIERAEQHARAITAETEALLRAERQAPVVGFIVADLSEIAACEAAASCISLKAGTGRGEVARLLEPLAARGAAVLAAVRDGAGKGKAALAAANATAAAYRAAITDTDSDVWARRSRAAGMDATLRQQLSAIHEAFPQAAVAAFAAELAQGVVIPGLPEVSARLAERLRGHAERLQAVDVGTEPVTELPPFPERPGVATAIGYVGHFWPLAAGVAAIEMVLPLTLWLLTLIAIQWSIERRIGPRPATESGTGSELASVDGSQPILPFGGRPGREVRG